jgi:predicted aconitase
MALELTAEDSAALDGRRGDAVAFAMRLVVRMAEISGASQLLNIEGAHIDGCLYHGRAGLDFARRLAEGGARVVVPTTLNSSSLDLLHPELVGLDAATVAEARALMSAYVSMGCRATWTCAPYQLPDRPAFGTHVAWAESNAIVFANSVLGARTDRYGDFLDICCAVTGRAPAAGLHLDEARVARTVVRLEGVPAELLAEEAAHAALGHVIGRATGTAVPVIVGLPPAPITTEDHLQALGAAAASSGSVGMFHAVGVTPEAPTLEAATGGAAPGRELIVTAGDLRAARDELGNVAEGGAIRSVCIGTPHASIGQIEQLAALTAGQTYTVPFFVNVGRDTLAEAERLGAAGALTAAGVTFVSDTCTYLAPIAGADRGPVMTNSAKWAWYAPGNLHVDVAFGTLEECVRSARVGRLVRDRERWDG